MPGNFRMLSCGLADFVQHRYRWSALGLDTSPLITRGRVEKIRFMLGLSNSYATSIGGPTQGTRTLERVYMKGLLLRVSA